MDIVEVIPPAEASEVLLQSVVSAGLLLLSVVSACAVFSKVVLVQ